MPVHLPEIVLGLPHARVHAHTPSYRDARAYTHGQLHASLAAVVQASLATSDVESGGRSRAHTACTIQNAHITCTRRGMAEARSSHVVRRQG